MAQRLADRLKAARHELFVGREAELACFRGALDAAELPFCVLHLSGPGGMGKTSLLREFGALCEARGVPVASLDSRDLEPTPEAFLAALGPDWGISPDAAPAGRRALLVDTYELLAPLDGWLREVFLPQMPDTVLTVLAGRQPLAPGWRSDAGWQGLVRALHLRNLSPDESRDYLLRRHLPPERHRAVLDFTHGHPLALSLAADLFAERGAERDGAFEEPDVVKALLERLVQKAPSPAHRHALEACALVRMTTEALLTELLISPAPEWPSTPAATAPEEAPTEIETPREAAPDAHDLFEWLRGLSFVEAGPAGLFPHDLAREALVADLRWRHPDWYAELHRRARLHYTRRLRQTTSQAALGAALGTALAQEQQHILFDYIFLHRDNSLVRPFLEWQASGSHLPGSARAEEMPALAAMVERHEGQAAARLARFWFARQPQAVLVLRDTASGAESGEPVGFVLLLALHRASAEDLERDPATRRAWEYLQSHAPLRRGEGATYFRFWMARDTHQTVSAAQSLIFVNMVRHYLTTPGLAFTFLPCAAPKFWEPVMAYAAATRLPEVDFVMEGRHCGVYGHDWRALPPLTWLDLLAEREIAAFGHTAPVAPDAAPPHPGGVAAMPGAVAPLVVLSRPEFDAAVQDALRHLGRIEALRGNVLLRARLVAERSGAAGTPERVAALQTLLREACASLQSMPREAKFYRALQYAYLQPASSQEQAAELAGVPFSTFRRHLKAGVEQVTELLWQREVGGD